MNNIVMFSLVFLALIIAGLQIWSYRKKEKEDMEFEKYQKDTVNPLPREFWKEIVKWESKVFFGKMYSGNHIDGDELLERGQSEIKRKVQDVITVESKKLDVLTFQSLGFEFNDPSKLDTFLKDVLEFSLPKETVRVFPINRKSVLVVKRKDGTVMVSYPKSIMDNYFKIY